MPAPAVTISTTSSPPPRSLPTETGPAYATGFAATGPVGTISTEDDALGSYPAWLRVYGGGSVATGRLPYSVMNDWVETYFRNGGNRLYFQREVGDTPVRASLNLAGTSGTTLIARATEYGAFYNTAYKVSVTNGSDASHRYVKLTAGASHPSTTDTVLAQSTNLTTRDDAVGQVLTDPVLGFSIALEAGGGSGLPTVASSTALAAGTDDHATADETNVAAAAALFPADLGPGQLVAPDHAGDPDVHLALMTAAPEADRFVIPDSADVDDTDESTLTTHGDALQGTTDGSYGALYAPWVTVQPLTANGTDRRVPPSALVCARLADTDARFHPNRAAAGPKDNVGVASSFVTGVGATFGRTPRGASAADRLDAAGVNLIINRRGQIMVFGIKTLVTPGGAENVYLQVPNARYRMWLRARAQAIAEGDQFDVINPSTIAAFHIGLEGLLTDDYARGIIVGDPLDDRFSTAARVDTSIGESGSDAPNTPETIDAGHLKAAVAVRPAKSAEFINITITAVSQAAAIA